MLQRSRSESLPISVCAPGGMNISAEYNQDVSRIASRDCS